MEAEAELFWLSVRLIAYHAFESEKVCCTKCWLLKDDLTLGVTCVHMSGVRERFEAGQERGLSILNFSLTAAPKLVD